MTRRVLVVDDEKGVREALKQVLEFEKIDVQTCASGLDALQAYAEFRPHLVFLDVKMQGLDGLEVLKRLREQDGHAQVVMISGHGTIQTAVEATQLGAYDFLEKPLDTDALAGRATRCSTSTSPSRTSDCVPRSRRATRSSGRPRRSRRSSSASKKWRRRRLACSSRVRTAPARSSSPGRSTT
jgi:DNA-binding NtrC family response regulator